MKKYHYFFIFTVLLSACGDSKQVLEKKYRPVKYITVGYASNLENKIFTGVAKTDTVIHLSFRKGGVITKMDLNLGQKVKKKQLLAELDNVQARLSVENSISSKNSAESQMRTSKSNLERVRALYEHGGSSLREFEAAKNAFRTSEQGFQSATRTVKIQEEQLNYGYLYAPADGVISSIEIEVDENIQAGQHVVTLNAGKNMDISLGIPESVINFIRLGMQVKVAFSAIKGEQFIAEVSEISPSLNTATSTYPITVRLSNPDARIRSGMSANVVFDFPTNIHKKDNIVIPAQAVGEDENGNFVFKLRMHQEQQYATIEKTHVQLGKLNDNGFEILSGINIGDKIATAGLQSLLNGQEVTLL